MNDVPPQLKVIYFGRVSKQSCTEPTFHPRWSVLTYGIFCYFRTCDKAKIFLESLPWSKCKDIQLSYGDHRTSFKRILERHPPRGYIKLLDRNGSPVSSLKVDRINQEITITHKQRQFKLKMDTKKSFNSWLSSFKSLQLSVEYDDVQYQNQDVLNNMNQKQSVSFSSSVTGQSEHIQTKNDDELQPRSNDGTIQTSNSLFKKYDEEEQRLLDESKRLEDLLKKDQNKILKSFQDIRQSITKSPDTST